MLMHIPVHVMRLFYTCFSVQNSGLGGLRHNTVVVGWPYGWRHNLDERSYKVFLGKLSSYLVLLK